MSKPLSLELKDLSTILKGIDQRLQSEAAPDTVVLNEFRQSVDNVRLTAWSVSEAINAEQAGKQHDTVLAFLSAERLRRLDQLVRNVCGDLERKVISSRSYGIDSLFDSVNVLRMRMAQCFAEQRKDEGESGDTPR